MHFFNRNQHFLIDSHKAMEWIQWKKISLELCCSFMLYIPIHFCNLAGKNPKF